MIIISLFIQHYSKNMLINNINIFLNQGNLQTQTFILIIIILKLIKDKIFALSIRTKAINSLIEES